MIGRPVLVWLAGGGVCLALSGLSPAWAQNSAAWGAALQDLTNEFVRQKEAQDAEKERQYQLERQRQQEEQRVRDAQQRAQTARSAQERQQAEERARSEKAAQVRSLPADRDDYTGQPCYHFNRPTLESVNGQARWNIYDPGTWVCHQDRMYQCTGPKWEGKGSCADWGTPASRSKLQSHVLEGAPPRPRGVTVVASASPSADGENPFRASTPPAAKPAAAAPEAEEENPFHAAPKPPVKAERSAVALEGPIVPKQIAVGPVVTPSTATSVPSPPPSFASEATVAAAISQSGGTNQIDELVAGNHSYDAKDWASAETHYKIAIKDGPPDLKLQGRLCDVQVKLTKFADAVATCQSAWKLAPREAAVAQNVAFSLFRLGKNAESVEWFQKAITAAPDWPPPYSGVASAHFALRNWAKAAEAYKQVLAKNPKDAGAWQALGYAAAELGRTSDAISNYRKAIELGNKSPDLYAGLGYQLYRQDQFAEAEKTLTEALRLNSNDAGTFATLGSVLDKLGRKSEAVDAWRRASELDPGGQVGAIARQNLANLAPSGISSTARK